MAIAEEFDPEAPVIEAIRSGDRFAYEEFFRRQNRWVRGVVFAALGDTNRVDDVAQQVWATVWDRISDLRDSRRWRPWLYRLAYHAAIDSGRDVTRRRRLKKEYSQQSDLRRPARTPEGRLIGSELHEAVLEAIAGLPALYREPFVLRHLNQWNCREIAEVMGMPIDTVETRLVRARRLLRESLKGKIE